MVAISGWLVTLCNDADKLATFTLTDPVRGMCFAICDVYVKMELVNLAQSSAVTSYILSKMANVKLEKQ